jgi:CHAT domain-containing protein/tetratricopeptide (TPR) repeat protein
MGSARQKPRGIAKALALVALASLCVSAVGPAADVDAAGEPSVVPRSPEEAQAGIADARAAARYDEAAALARELLLLRESDPASRPFEVTDARWLLALLERAASLPREHRRQLALVDSLQAVADGSWDAGTYEVGLAAAERRLAILREHLGPEHPEAARSLDDAGGFLLGLGRAAEGEDVSLEGLAMRRALLGDEHPLVAESMTNLAEFADLRGDYAEAVRLSTEAAELYRLLFPDGHPDLAIALSNQGLYLHHAGDFEAAEALYRECIEMDARFHGTERAEYATGLDNLGTLLMDMGDYAAAEPLCREALAVRRRVLGPDHPFVALGLANLGVLLTYQGDYQGAEELALESLDIRRRVFGDDHPTVAFSLANIATLHYEWGDAAASIPWNREALARVIRLVGERHPRTALCYHNLGCSLADAGDTDGAEESFRRALTIRREILGGDHADVAATTYSLAQLLCRRGEYETAEALFREALAIYRRSLGQAHGDVVSCLHGLGRLLLATGDWDAAERTLASASASYDAARPRAGSGYMRTTFSESPYAHLAGARLRLGRDDAWQAAERALGRSLADLLMSAEERELTPAEAAREDSLGGTMSDLERLLSASREAARDDTTGETERRVEEARLALLAAEAEWSAFRREISAKYPVTEGEAFPLERVQARLTRTQALLSWLDVEWPGGTLDSWGYVVRDSGAVSWVRLEPGRGAASELIERPKRLGRMLADPEESELALVQEARALWRERIGPMARHLAGVDELVVIPSGAMLGVPVAALVDPDGRTLGERYAVSYAPSATIFAWLAERDARREGRLARTALLLGDPPFAPSHVAPPGESDRHEGASVALRTLVTDGAAMRSALAGDAEVLGSLPRLVGTREEIVLAAPLFPGATVLLGRDASEERLVGEAESGALGSFGTIHLATHALVDDGRPERSALVLSQLDLPDPFESALRGDRIYDGLLTAREIVREWRLDADLVTLSACETGLGREVVGEGYIGFAQAFLQAGARSLLVSLWKVEDRATALLMHRFYESLYGSRGGDAVGVISKSRALSEAQSWLRTYTDDSGRHPYEHPYYWSAFILIGDPD